MQPITYRLEFKNPVLVTDFCDSLTALSDEYCRLKALQEHPDYEAYDLYVEKITEGSIVAILQEYAPYAIAIAEAINNSHDLLGNLKKTIDGLRSKIGPRPDFDPEQLENAAKFVVPLTRDVSSSIVLSGNTFNGPVTINLNSTAGAEIKKNAEFELHEMGRAKLEIKEGVALRWYQARNDPKSKSGDRAIIEAISPKSIRTVFIGEGLKSKMIGAKDNPFKQSYVVSVAIETVGGRPTKYQIIDVHATE
ncbi:MAG: hypothetical protein U1F61_24630 [Opitutaceae bacterium]